MHCECLWTPRPNREQAYSAEAAVVNEADGVRLGSDARDSGEESGGGNEAEGEHCIRTGRFEEEEVAGCGRSAGDGLPEVERECFYTCTTR